MQGQSGWQQPVAGQTRDLRKSPIVIIGGGFLALAFALVLLVGMLMVGERALTWASTRHYVEAPATVVSARPVGHGKFDNHRLEVVYTYEVDGREYRGSNGETAVENLTERQAEKAAAKYAPGTAITVYVDPQEPAESRFERDAGFGAMIGKTLLPLGAMIVFIGLPLARVFRSQRRAQARQSSANQHQRVTAPCSVT